MPKLKTRRRVNLGGNRSRKAVYELRMNPSSLEHKIYFKTQTTGLDGTKIAIEGIDSRKLRKKHLKTFQTTPYAKIKGTALELYGRGKGPKARKNRKPKKKKTDSSSGDAGWPRPDYM